MTDIRANIVQRKIRLKSKFVLSLHALAAVLIIIPIAFVVGAFLGMVAGAFFIFPEWLKDVSKDFLCHWRHSSWFSPNGVPHEEK